MAPRFARWIKAVTILILMLTLYSTLSLFIMDEHNHPKEVLSYDEVLKAYQRLHDPDDSIIESIPRSRKRRQKRPTRESFISALTNVASPDKVVLISLIDWGYIDMALNFYETSLYRHGIDNYLFLSTDAKSCQLMDKIGVSCHMFVSDKSAKTASEYGSEAFLRKMNYRTKIIIEALQAGFTILHSDIDITFIKNPFNYINCSDKCDIKALWDATKYNAGFIYIRPTENSLKLYNTMLSISNRKRKMDDQIQMVNALETMKKKNIPININRLPIDLFQCGRCYFEDIRRTFAGDLPCKECVVVHNNWIVTKEAKRYRAREHHHWYHDWSGYYSDANAKYILYDNPISDCTTYWEENEIKQRELNALQNALAFGHILNRIVILPAFHCGQNLCALNSFIKIKNFDKSFAGRYREHTFLQHMKVPEEVINGKSELFYIPGSNVEKWCISSFGNFFTIPEIKSLDDIEIKEIFGDNNASILRFYSMHDSFKGFSYRPDRNNFNRLIDEGFKESDYRQQKAPGNK